MPVLVALDAVGIQRYVFASNRLRDVVGASRLVELALSDEPKSLVVQASAGLGTVLIAAGGNALLSFGDIDGARLFTGAYTRRLLDKAPGLEVAVAQRQYTDGELARAVLAIQVDLARAKAELRPSAPLLGLGVTAPCRVTGRPATGVGRIANGPTVPLSALVQRARSREIYEDSQHHWQEFLHNVELPGDLQAAFPSELDQLGRTRGERSLIGVFHVDGNGVGHQIIDWLNRCVASETDDDTVLAQYRTWSRNLSLLARHALEVVVERVARSIQPTVAGHAAVHGLVPALDFELGVADGVVHLPLRPILLGGDDLTFVCDGRIALDLAATAVDAFRRVVAALGPEPLSACAGVAVIAAHSPFIRAYELATDLCTSAKREAHSKGWRGGAIDWHIGAFRPGESVASIRRRQYHQGNLDLTCRPYPVAGEHGKESHANDDGHIHNSYGANDDEWSPTWEWFSTQLLGTGNDGLRGPAWTERRSKAKSLPWIARDGPEAIERSMTAWGVSAPSLSLPAGVDRGFSGARSPLVDAGELLDRMQILSLTSVPETAQ
jgi:hypothetical protein